MLTNYFDEFIQSLIKTGRYKNVSEVVRAGLRRLEEDEELIVVSHMILILKLILKT